MAAPASSSLLKEFHLDPSILGPNSAQTVAVSLATDADVLQAILGDKPFPTRPNGKLELGSVMLQAQGGNQVTFNAGQGSISFDFSAGFHTGLGVFDQAADAIGSLQLNAPPQLDLTLGADPASRYLLMLWGYQASGSFSGSHPIGALGTVTFGAQASGDAVYAVLHRFPGTTGASTVIGDTVQSWRLPRHVAKAGDLKPGTWVLAQADGSIAIQVAAQLGYNFDFVRQANLLGITRQLGARIDAGVKATFGFNASGRYIVVIGRESDSPTVRLRLYKQSDQGFDFGLNLSVGVQEKGDLPANIDDFVKAVFGVHGLQVVKDLHLISDWTDPAKDLGQTAARLLNDTGLDLLTKATGIDARKEFEKARQLVLHAFVQWDALPQRAAAAVWRILGKLDAPATNEFQTFLTALADPDPQSRASALSKALQQITFGDTPQGQFLAAIADQGLLALGGQLDRVQQAASQTLNILNGGIIKQIQDFINQRLDLNAVRNVVTQNDFDKLDGWLVKRLGDFLDKELDLAALKEVQVAINTVIQKASDIYDRALKALTNHYSLDFAATYQRSKTDTALLDVNFDLSDPAASSLLQEVVARSVLDRLLTTKVPGVTLNQATLSHEIKRTSDVQVHMPFFDSDVQHINDSLATLTVEHDSGRVLAYQLGATDTVTAKNRYRSQLSLLGNLKVINGAIQMAPGEDQALAYQSLQIKSKMTLSELEFRTKPFIQANLGSVFTDDASLDRFYLALDQTISNMLSNRNNDFGDVAVNLQVALPASVLDAWFQSRTAGELKSASMLMSRALQARLKQLIPLYYFQNLGNLQPNETAAALLIWAAFPVSTSIDFQDGQIRRFNTDQDVFWNFPDPNLRRSVAFDVHTTRSLVPALMNAHERLIDAGDSHTAAFFTADGAATFQQFATNTTGDVLLQSLLFTEAQMVSGAETALKDVQDLLSNAATVPTLAMARLADFGATITSTFNKRLSIYGNESLRTLNSMLLAEASAAMSPGLAPSIAMAMLNLLVLKPQHTFQLAGFLNGDLPARNEVAVSQVLTNLT